jgi:hypothetical protein
VAENPATQVDLVLTKSGLRTYLEQIRIHHGQLYDAEHEAAALLKRALTRYANENLTGRRGLGGADIKLAVRKIVRPLEVGADFNEDSQRAFALCWHRATMFLDGPQRMPRPTGGGPRFENT